MPFMKNLIYIHSWDKIIGNAAKYSLLVFYFKKLSTDIIKHIANQFYFGIASFPEYFVYMNFLYYGDFRFLTVKLDASVDS